MSLSEQQVATLLNLVSTTESDSLDCDGCFGKIAEFAELRLKGRSVPDAMKAVEVHLRQCHCCQTEFEALMDALGELDGDTVRPQ
ncbi:hypothetical protein [Crateriforma spongiae]|uniref:hypothetical protein n=1 Tax=Crateriforma spongiae TaxID=2724528 RepID=UPI0014473A51|nr:hypothetical protein [Crateriforma spongiae]